MRTIDELIDRARRRIRIQAALEAATTAAIGASVGAGVVVVLVRIAAISHAIGVAALAVAPVVVAAAAAIAAIRRPDANAVARRIDRASGLADRLATAVEFAREPASDADGFRGAAIDDAIRAVPRARVEAAAPYAVPRHARAAAAYLIAAIVLAIVLPAAIAPGGPRRLALQAPPAEPGPKLGPDGTWDVGYPRDTVDQLRGIAIQRDAPAFVALADDLDRQLDRLALGAIDHDELLESLSRAERAAMNAAPVDDAVAMAVGDVREAVGRMVPGRKMARLGPPPPPPVPPPPPPPPPPANPGGPGTEPADGGHGHGHEPSDHWGTGAAALFGVPTPPDPATADVRVDGDPPDATGSIRSTIRDAARRGFASTPYAHVYQDYAAITEHVMHAEAIPLSHRYLVKKYFWAIRPE